MRPPFHPARSPSSILVRIIGGALLVASALTLDGPVQSVTERPAEDLVARAVPYARGDLASRDDPVRVPRADTTDQTEAITYPDGPELPASPGETRSVDVLIRNEGNANWEAAGANAVKLSYHLYDVTGKLLAWDGLRTTLPYDISPGFGSALALRVALPARTGVYSIKPDLLRDGQAWFSSAGAVASAIPLRVTADLDAGYGATTAPASIVPGGEVNIDVRVTNTGLKPWPAGGEHPVRLGYHWFDMSSQAVVWDGARTLLPHDVAPGESVTLTVDMRAPRNEGAYALAWDMVQEGANWFSTAAVPMKEDLVVVQRGVTFYGKGWGHGIGLSQWGAQGWAEGAAGVRLTGEQIVAKYFPGAHLGSQPISKPFRVLLSAPSTACIARTIWDVARMESEGGMRLVNDADPSVVYFDAAPSQPLRFTTYGSTLIATDQWSGRRVYIGEDIVTLVPTQWWDPIYIDQKGLGYRGNVQVQVRDEGNLRVVNYVSSDDYMRGTLPGEMPGDWEMEALRAQAITARTYAAWRQATAGDRTWDVRDDTADQCYGGRSFESPRTSAAVESTPAQILTYAGKPIRALFSSAHGGISENVGCLLDAERVGTTWKCADGWPYLAIVDDPAEVAAYDARGQNPYGLWSRFVPGDVIREQIIEDYGVDIGDFVSMEFNLSPGGRPISVLVRGTGGWVDLKGDRFLRTTLGLRSSLVRMIPF
ncbi:MAG TPA: SpoIID/LytB domain-containing protein [Candidatus Limnocylindria bacterium]|nr:SpoIID/LytB domain-containing protein [Candidatus Limnocylindria bacterium]